MSREDMDHHSLSIDEDGRILRSDGLRSTFRTPVQQMRQPDQPEDRLASLNSSFGTLKLGSKLYGSLSSLFHRVPTPQSAMPRRTLEDIRADVIRQQHQRDSIQNFADRTSNTLQQGEDGFDLELQQQASFSDASVRTEDISLVSHLHGKERRSERKILRKELQAAIKYGQKETANPGRDGSHRWRYTHNGVVFITDETSRHEVTSWRIDGKDEEDTIAPAEVQLRGSRCHAVLIVDHSGSMRNADVPGYESRAHAVFECLKRDFAGEQLKAGAAHDVIVTLISMSDTATVLLHKKPLDTSLIVDLQRLSKRRPRSHGNYIPALDKALEVMKADASVTSSLLLLFFSDGAPSDHYAMQCLHGINIFEVDHKRDPKMLHASKQQAWRCKNMIYQSVEKKCCERVKSIGQVFGRDKVVFRTIAFGPPGENFSLMEKMANVLPRGEFQKLELSAASLKTSFSSLSSSLSTLRTEGGHRILTRRSDKVVDRNQKVDITSVILSGKDGWWIYGFKDLIGKYEFKANNSSGKLRPIDLSFGANGIAFLQHPFAEGAERFVFRCSEVVVRTDDYDYAASEGNTADRSGLRLVAKEAKDLENHHQGRKFHETFARIQSEAAELALAFTLRLPSARPEWNVNFIDTHIYGCYDDSYKYGQAWILVERELDGRFTKWNNNAGEVRVEPSARGKPHGVGSNFLEDLEESNENDDGIGAIQIDDVPQAFSHFSYEHSRGMRLVCDLQGVWNADDGFVLTDPVIHHVSFEGHRHVNGATDQGQEGVKRFFSTHLCNSLCKRMMLPPRSPDSLIHSNPREYGH